MYLDDRDYRAPRGFNALFSVQTYKNILYLFLSFPLGLMYFILFVVGFSVGFGLLVILVGLPILMMVMMGANALAGFERELNRLLLGVDIEKPLEDDYGNDWRGKVRGFFNPQSVMNLIYLFLKFPFGVLAFVVSMVLVSITFGMIFAPFGLMFGEATVEIMFFNIDNLMIAFLTMGMGLLLAPITLTITNQLAQGWGIVAERLLNPVQGRRDERSVTPAKNDDKRTYTEAITEPAQNDYFYTDSEIIARGDTPPKLKNRFLKEQE